MADQKKTYKLDTDYPDVGPPDFFPEDYATVKFLPGQQRSAPEIWWGVKFDKMTTVQQIERAKKVANAMNHAADIAQQQYFELCRIANHQEDQIRQKDEIIASQSAQIAELTTRINRANQRFNEEMKRLKNG